MSWRALVTTLFCSCVAASAEASGPTSVVEVDRGFIEDVMAFSPSGDRLAYLHTDSATFLTLVIMETRRGQAIRRISLPSANRVVHTASFSQSGKRLMLLWRDGDSDRQAFTLFDARSGRVLKESRPATATHLIAYAKKQVISVVEERLDRKHNLRVKVSLFESEEGKLLRQASTVMNADGTIGRDRSQFLYWVPGQVAFVARRRGGFDKKQDMRLPDLIVKYDIVAAKQVWSDTPSDLIAWTRAFNLRQAHAGQHRFVAVSGDLTSLLYVTRKNKLRPLTTPVPFHLYEPKSLRQQEHWNGRSILFSFTVDPVNPVALKRKKADPERVDIYQLDSRGQLALLGQVLTKGRRFAWAVGKTHFAYLRKLKGFDRGGLFLEIHRLASTVSEWP